MFNKDYIGLDKVNDLIINPLVINSISMRSLKKTLKEYNDSLRSFNPKDYLNIYMWTGGLKVCHTFIAKNGTKLMVDMNSFECGFKIYSPDKAILLQEYMNTDKEYRRKDIGRKLMNDIEVITRVDRITSVRKNGLPYSYTIRLLHDEGEFTFMIKDIQFEYVLDWISDYRVIVNQDNMCGMKDNNKNIIIPFEYDYITSLPNKSLDAFIIRNNNKWGLYDINKHKEIIPPTYNKKDDIIKDKRCSLYGR